MTTPLDPRHAVAIVGLSCRLPGAENPAALWRALDHGTDAIGEIPPDRYDGEHYRAEGKQPGKVTTTRGSFLQDVAGFDAEFFGLDDVQAMWLDPQQRLLLMCAWDALEDAGIPPSAVRGARGAVFVGNNRTDYLREQMFLPDEELSPLTMLNLPSMMSGRLAHVLDWRGPNMYLDTGCSGTLVGLHLACQALRTGDATIAMATGVNVKMRPTEDIVMSTLGMQCADGRCKFGDESADGWTPGDGAGALVLKRLDRALADGDRIRAIVRGSAVSSDGASSGMLLKPSIEGQLQTLEWAYEAAGVEPAEVDFLEAHGTGTRLIDPIELAAFGQFFSEGRPADRPLLIGSVKTNVGHAESASGIASIIKTTLSLEHRLVPKTLHHDRPAASVAWDEYAIRVPTEPHAFAPRETPLIAGLGGQGISCVNAHVVLQEAPPREATAPDDGSPRLLMLSARNPQALADLRARYAAWIAPGGTGAEVSLRDLSASAAKGRDHHQCRWAAIAVDRASLHALLEAGSAEGRASDVDSVGGASARTAVENAATFARNDESLDALRELASDYLASDPRTDLDLGLVTSGGGFADLPSYPWQLSPHWIRPSAPIAPVTADVVVAGSGQQG